MKLHLLTRLLLVWGCCLCWSVVVKGQCIETVTGPSGIVPCDAPNQTLSATTNPPNLASQLQWTGSGASGTGASITYDPDCALLGNKQITPFLPAGTAIPTQNRNIPAMSGNIPGSNTFTFDNVCFGPGISYTGIVTGSVTGGSGDVVTICIDSPSLDTCLANLPVGIINSQLSSGLDLGILLNAGDPIDPNGTWVISIAGSASSYSLNAINLQMTYPNGLSNVVVGAPVNFTVTAPLPPCPTLNSVSATPQVCSGGAVTISAITTPNGTPNLQYIVSGSNGFSYTGNTPPTDNPTNTTCNPITVSYTVTVKCTNDNSTLGTQTLTTTVFPAINLSSVVVDNTTNITDPGCSFTVTPACSAFSVNGSAGATTIAATPGDNGSAATIVIGNGLAACNTNLAVPVTCIGNCVQPTTTITEICSGSNNFNIQVVVSSMGDASSFVLQPSQGNAVTVTATGTYTLGAYPNNAVVNVKALNPNNAACNANLGNFTKGCKNCPNITGIQVTNGGTICTGTNVLLNAQVIGGIENTDYTVQWQLDGVDIPGGVGKNYSYELTATGCQPQTHTFTAVVTCLTNGTPAANQSFTTSNITVYPIPEYGVDFFPPADCSVSPTFSPDCTPFLVATTNPPPPGIAVGQQLEVIYSVQVNGAPSSCRAAGRYLTGCPAAVCAEDAGAMEPAVQTVCWGDDFALVRSVPPMGLGYRSLIKVTDQNGNAVTTYGPYTNEDVVPPYLFTNDNSSLLQAGNTYCFTPTLLFNGRDLNPSQPGIQNSYIQTGSHSFPPLDADCIISQTSPDCQVEPYIYSFSVSGIPFCAALSSYVVTMDLSDNTSLPFTNPWGTIEGSGVVVKSADGDTLQLINNEGTYSFIYNGNPNGINVSFVGIYPNPLSSANANWTFTITLNDPPTFPVVCPACNDVGEPACVTLLANPTVANIPNPAATCAGSVIDLTDFNPIASQQGTYTWYDGNPATNGSVINNPTSYTITTTTNFYVRYNSNQGGCEVLRNFSYSVNTVPNLNTPATTPVCPGTAVSLTLLQPAITTAAGSFAWYIGDPDAGGAPISNPASVTPIGSEPYYAVFTSSSSGCKNKAFATYTYNNPPLLLAQIPAVCVGTQVDLRSYQSAINASAGTFVWYNGNPNSGGTVLNPNANNQILVTPINGAAYYVHFTSTVTGCSNTSLAVTFTVNPLPALTVPTPTAVCAGSTVDLTALQAQISSAAGTFSWFLGNPATNGTAIGTPNSVVPVAGNVFYVRFTDATTGCINTINFTYPLNVGATLNSIAAQVLCPAETPFSLTVLEPQLSNQAGMSYAWYDGNPASGGTFIDPANVFNNPSLQDIPDGSSKVYYVVATNANACTSQTTVNYQVLQPITNGAAYYDCAAGVVVNLGTAVGGSGSYQVSPASPHQAGQQLPHLSTWTVIIGDSEGCQQAPISGTVDCPVCEAGAAESPADKVLCCQETLTINNPTAFFSEPENAVIGYGITSFDAGAVTTVAQATALGEQGRVIQANDADNSLSITRDCNDPDALPAGHYLATPFTAERPVPCLPADPILYSPADNCDPYILIHPELSGTGALITQLSISFPNGQDTTLIGVGGILPSASLATVAPLLANGLPLNGLYGGDPNGEWCITLTNGGTAPLVYNIPDFDVIVSADSCTLITQDQISPIEGVSGSVGIGQTQSLCLNIPSGGNCGPEPVLYSPADNCDPSVVITPALSGNGAVISQLTLTFPNGQDTTLIGVGGLLASATPATVTPLLAGGLPLQALYPGNPNGTWSITLTNSGTAPLVYDIPAFNIIVSADSCTLITEDQITPIEGISGNVPPNSTRTINLVIPPTVSDFPTIAADCQDFGTATDFYVLDNLNYTNVLATCVNENTHLYAVTISGLSGGAVGIIAGASYSFGSPATYNAANDSYTFQATLPSFPATVSVSSNWSGIAAGSSCNVLSVPINLDPCICIPPLVGAVGSCMDENAYTALVNLAQVGSSATYTLTDNQGSAPISGITASGSYQIGSYSNNVPVIITLVTDDAECNVSININKDCTECDAGMISPTNAIICPDGEQVFTISGANINNTGVEHVLAYGLGYAPMTSPADTISMVTMQPADSDNSISIANNSTYDPGYYYLTPFIAVSPGALPQEDMVTYSPANGCNPVGNICPDVTAAAGTNITVLSIEFPDGSDTTIVGPGGLPPVPYSILNGQCLGTQTLFAGDPNGDWCITIAHSGSSPLVFTVPAFDIVVNDASCTLISGGDEVWNIPAVSGSVEVGETKTICLSIPPASGGGAPAGFPSFDPLCTAFGNAVPVILTSPINFDLTASCDDANNDGIDDSYIITLNNLSGGSPDLVNGATYSVSGFTQINATTYRKTIALAGAVSPQLVTVQDIVNGNVQCERTKSVLLPNCLTSCQPTATFAIDCPEQGNQFYVNIDVTNFGGLSTAYNVVKDGVSLTTITTATAMPVQVGPFSGSSPITLSLSSTQNSACNLSSGALVPTCCYAGTATAANAVVCGNNSITLTANGASVADGYVVGWLFDDQAANSPDDLATAILIEPSVDGTNSLTLQGNDLDTGVYTVTPFVSLAGDVVEEPTPCLPYNPDAGCIPNGTTFASASGSNSLITQLKLTFPDGSDTTIVPGTLPSVSPALYSILPTLPLSLQSLYPGDPNGEWCVTLTNSGTGPLDFALNGFDVTLNAADCSLIDSDIVFSIPQTVGVVQAGETKTICFNIPPAGACPDTGGGEVTGEVAPCPIDCMPNGTFQPSLTGSQAGWSIFPMLITLPDGSQINVVEKLTEQLIGSPLNIPIDVSTLALLPGGVIPPIATTTLYDGNPTGEWLISVTNIGTGTLAFNIPSFELVIDADSCDGILSDVIIPVNGIVGSVAPGTTETFTLNIPQALCEFAPPSNFPSIGEDCNNFGTPATLIVTDPITYDFTAACNDTNGDGFGDNYLLTISNIAGGAPAVTPTAQYTLGAGYVSSGDGSYTTTLAFGGGATAQTSVGSNLAGDCSPTIKTLNLPTCPQAVCEPIFSASAFCNGEIGVYYVNVNVTNFGDINNTFTIQGMGVSISENGSHTAVVGPFTAATTTITLVGNTQACTQSATVTAVPCESPCTAGTASPANVELCCGGSVSVTTNGANLDDDKMIVWALSDEAVTNAADLANAIDILSSDDSYTTTFESDCSQLPAGQYFLTPVIVPQAEPVAVALECVGVGSICPNVQGNNSLVTVLRIVFPNGSDTTIIGTGGFLPTAGPPLYPVINSQCLPLSSLYGGVTSGTWLVEIANGGTGDLSFALAAFDITYSDTTCSGLTESVTFTIPALSGTVAAGTSISLPLEIPAPTIMVMPQITDIDPACSGFGVPAIVQINASPESATIAPSANIKKIGCGVDNTLLLSSLLLSGNANGTWSGSGISGNTFSSETAGTFTLTYTIAATSPCANLVYTTLVTVSDDCGCFATNPNAAQNATVCAGSTGTIAVAAAPEGYDIAWYATPTATTVLAMGNTYSTSVCGTYYAEMYSTTNANCTSQGRTAVTLNCVQPIVANDLSVTLYLADSAATASTDLDDLNLPAGSWQLNNCGGTIDADHVYTGSLGSCTLLYNVVQPEPCSTTTINVNINVVICGNIECNPYVGEPLLPADLCADTANPVAGASLGFAVAPSEACDGTPDYAFILSANELNDSIVAISINGAFDFSNLPFGTYCVRTLAYNAVQIDAAADSLLSPADYTLDDLLTQIAALGLVSPFTVDNVAAQLPTLESLSGVDLCYDFSEENVWCITYTNECVNSCEPPAAPIALQDSVAVCADANLATIAVAEQAGMSITWYDAAVNGNIVGTSETLSAACGTYYAQAERLSPIGCVSDTRTLVTIYCIAPVEPATVTSSASIRTADCATNNSLNLASLITSGNTNGSWTSDGGGTISNGTFSATNAATYQLVYTIDPIEPCLGISYIVTVVVQSCACGATTPTNPVSAVVCAGNEAILSVDAPADGYGIRWYNTATGGTSIAQGNTLTTNNCGSYYAETYSLTEPNCVSERVLATLECVQPVTVTVAPINVFLGDGATTASYDLDQLDLPTGTWLIGDCTTGSINADNVYTGSEGSCNLLYVLEQPAPCNNDTISVTINVVSCGVITCQANAGEPLPPTGGADALCADAVNTVSGASAGFAVAPSGVCQGTPNYTFVVTDAAATIIGLSANGSFDFTGLPFGTYCFTGLAYNELQISDAASNLPSPPGPGPGSYTLADLLALADQFSPNPLTIAFVETLLPTLEALSGVDVCLDFGDAAAWCIVYQQDCTAPDTTAPTLGDDSLEYTLAVGDSLQVNLITDSGATDPPNGTVTLVDVSIQPEGAGTVTFDEEGNLVFVPTDGFTGTVVIEFTIADAAGNTVTGTATVVVLSDACAAQLPIDMAVLTDGNNETYTISGEFEGGLPALDTTEPYLVTILISRNDTLFSTLNYTYLADGGSGFMTDALSYLAGDVAFDVTVIVTDNSGCYTDSAMVVLLDPNVGIDDVLEDNFLLTIAPIPATNVLQVAFATTHKGTAQLSLYDAAGKLMTTQTVQTHVGANAVVLDVAAYSAGVYFLHINTGNSLLTAKVMKQ